MTYADLLKESAQRKAKAVHDLNHGISDPQLGFLVRDEIRRSPGGIAWVWLGLPFCRTLAENWEEIWSSASEDERDDICRIYMAYEDSDPEIYDLLPVEAQLYE